MIGFAVKPLPDAPWKWPLICFLVLFFGGASYVATKFIGLVGFVVTTPLLAIVGAHILVELGAMGYQWLRWTPYAEWQGNYYDFEGQHLRVVDLDDALWVVDRDVLAVVGMRKSSSVLKLFGPREHARLPDTIWFGFSQAGVERLLAKSTHRDAKRLRVWMEREVYAPHRNKIERRREALQGTPVLAIPDVMPEPAALKPKENASTPDAKPADARKVF
jgi:hypothetical protein